MTRELTTSILDRLSSIHGLKVKVHKPAPNLGQDGAMDLHYMGRRARFRLEIRKQITTTAVHMMLSRRTPEQFHNLLLLAPVITPACARMLQTRDICYADAAGNLFLHAGPLYLHVSGQKTPKEDHRTNLMPVRQSFAANALKIVFALLTDPDLDRDPARALLARNYREMGAITGLPLGSIATTMSALRTGGYVVAGKNGERLLLERKKLMARWLDDYAARLRPRLVTGHYHIPSAQWWVRTAIQEGHGLWGGEIAGAKLTAYLSPETATIYSDDLPGGFVLSAALYKDPAGKMEVLRPFWGPIPWARREDCVHPLLVYADLIASEIDRNIDTAQRIYDRYLRQIIERD